jgi:hypothetical protein
LLGGGLALALAVPTGAIARTTPPVPSARPLLITRAALGSGWSVSAPAPAHVPAISCHTLPSALRSQPRQAAITPTFSQADAGPFVQQTAYRWARPATATAVWRQISRSSMLACLAQSVTRGDSSAVKFTVTGRHGLAAPRLPVPIRGYRVMANAKSGGQVFPAYVDELVLNTPGAVSEVSFATFEQPPSARLEARIARLVQRRGGSPAHAPIAR